jgi:hypothetical protein
MSDGPSSQRRTKEQLKGKAKADAIIKDRGSRPRYKVELKPPPKTKPKRIK